MALKKSLGSSSVPMANTFASIADDEGDFVVKQQRRRRDRVAEPVEDSAPVASAPKAKSADSQTPAPAPVTARWGDDSGDEAGPDHATSAALFLTTNGPVKAINEFITAVRTRHKFVTESAASNEKQLVSDLHDLSTQVQKNALEIRGRLNELIKAIDEINAQKGSILDGWRKFVEDVEGARDPVAEPEAREKQLKSEPTRAPSVGSYASMVRPVSTTSHPSSTTQVRFGLASVSAQVADSASDVPRNSIRFIPSLGVFAINWNDSVYSFGPGVFVTRKGRGAEDTLYGKRCNLTNCMSADKCTYYHDPLRHANGHIVRNMGVHYILEDLIKGVASDADIETLPLNKNQFLVQDLVQLAGILLIKAAAVKSVIDSSPQPDNRRSRRS